MTDAAPIPCTPAPITCEREFLEALRARREQLQLGYESIEAMCDLPSGYAGKLLRGVRPVGALTLWLLLQSLGLRIRVEEDPEALERNRRSSQWGTVRRKPKQRPGVRTIIALARRRNAPWLWDSERARQAAMMRWHRSGAETAG
jgi:hypothetical protein